jgi:hypothetical protein
MTAVVAVVLSAALEHLIQVRQTEDRMVPRVQTILGYRQQLLLLTLHGSALVPAPMTA